ncbi:MAG: Mechanosensitive channel MscK [Gammaproteobacteria bacterium]|nr:Mechanosensitive channel MscK [Gammaproteobacteria bacterium]
MNSLSLIRPVTCAFLILICQAVVAQPEDLKASGDLIRNLRTSLDILEVALERPRISNEEIDDIRRQVEFVVDNARRIRATSEEKLEEQARLFEALGPKPAKSEPPEAKPVAVERKQIEETIAEYRGYVKSANVILARGDTLRARMARAEFGVVAQVLGQRTQTPLAPELIVDAVFQLPRQLDRFTGRLTEWWQSIEFDRERIVSLIGWLVLLASVVAGIVPTRNWVLRRFGPDRRDDSPSYIRRFKVMTAVGLGNVVLPLVSIVGLYVVLLENAEMTPALHRMTWLLTVTLCQYFLITGLAAAAMSPGFPRWRISRFTDESADRLYESIRLFATIVVVVNLARIVIAAEGTGRFAQIVVMDMTRDALHTLFGAAALAVIALSVINILRKENWWLVFVADSGQTTLCPPSNLIRTFMLVAKVGLVLSLVAALIGYVNLGLFLCQRIVWSLLLIAFAYAFRALIATTCNQAVQEDSDVGALLRKKMGYSGTGAMQLMFWAMLVVDLVLVVSAIILLLLIWGVRAADIQSTGAKLLYGVNIGNFTLSLVDIGVALGIFVILFVGVRLLQGFLSNRVLARTVPDVGVRDALTTGLGYVGIFIAALIAISSLGLELSQLAIVFGALSVGIGFGLQHVVNNFVSGLTLLIYRPIKAGDWIVVGRHEGYVKKINVVATEIQTFDNAAVIVPNSQLVSSEVLNWTHKSTVARVIVSVRASHDSDPHQVHDLLLHCARDREDILQSPAPVVVFREFGDSALIFELRFFIRQADYMLITASDLRFVIADTFRAAGIVIPYPQHDIHIKGPGIADAGTVDPAGQSRITEPSSKKPAPHVATPHEDKPSDDADGN